MNKGRGIYRTPYDEKRERFFSRIIKTSSCWLWEGTHDIAGYGRFYADSTEYKAHIISYEFHNGPIEKGLYVCHNCFNHGCVRPDHLYLGTQKDNMNDEDVINQRKSRLVLAEEDIALIFRMRDEGLSMQKIADLLNVSHVTIQRACYGTYAGNYLRGEGNE